MVPYWIKTASNTFENTDWLGCLKYWSSRNVGSHTNAGNVKRNYKRGLRDFWNREIPRRATKTHRFVFWWGKDVFFSLHVMALQTVLFWNIFFKFITNAILFTRTRTRTLLTILILYLHLHLHCTSHAYALYTSTTYKLTTTNYPHTLRFLQPFIVSPLIPWDACGIPRLKFGRVCFL